jgi:hypothetical protein
VNLLQLFLATLARQSPPWARNEINQLARLMDGLRAVPRTTTLLVLAAVAFSLVFKALTIAALTLLLAACWLVEKALSSAGVDWPLPDPAASPPTIRNP